MMVKSIFTGLFDAAQLLKWRAQHKRKSKMLAIGLSNPNGDHRAKKQLFVATLFCRHFLFSSNKKYYPNKLARIIISVSTRLPVVSQTGFLPAQHPATYETNPFPSRECAERAKNKTKPTGRAVWHNNSRSFIRLLLLPCPSSNNTL